jgi:hypothetical protein
MLASYTMDKDIKQHMCWALLTLHTNTCHQKLHYPI